MSVAHNAAVLRFKSLLHREWMQHHRGWLAVMLVPLVLTLLTMPFTVRVGDPGEIHIGIGQLNPASALALAVCGGSMLGVVGLTLLAQLFQMPGLARRDAQDRSLEFWMSLPGSNSEHLAATLVAHTLMVLVLASGVGVLSGLVMAPVAVAKLLGLEALSQVDWGAVLQLLLPGLVRLLAGMPLFVLWLLPVVLVFMAASAWLKRWGVPMVVVAGVVLGNLPVTAGPVRAWLEALVVRFNETFFVGSTKQADVEAKVKAAFQSGEPSAFWQLVGHDLATQLGHLFSPMFLSVLAISAACFAALVYKRKHHLG